MHAKEGEFAQRMADNHDQLAVDGDVAELDGIHSGASVLVAAAGPTLADHFERLRNRPAGQPLVAVDAALKPLLAAGIRPDYVVAADSHQLGLRRLFDIDSSQVERQALLAE